MPITAKLEKLVSILADGRFHSGQDIGKVLSLSRGGVWKLVQSLEPLGLDVFAIPGKGYRLSQGFELLDHNRVLSILDDECKRDIAKLIVRMLVDSTNDDLKKESQNAAQHGSVLLAEYQLKGRGRRGRQWLAPFASSIFLSLVWRFEEGYSQFNGLSIVVALSVLQALQGLGADKIQLKWPNDLLHENRKLAGILVELGTDKMGQPFAVVGLGLNVNLGRFSHESIDQEIIDIYRAGLEGVSRNLLVARILNKLFRNLNQFTQQGLKPFMQFWQDYDCLHGQTVQIFQADESIRGIAQGIDDTGALILHTEEGPQRFYSGDVSLRKPIS